MQLVGPYFGFRHSQPATRPSKSHPGTSTQLPTKPSKTTYKTSNPYKKPFHYLKLPTPNLSYKNLGPRTPTVSLYKPQEPPANAHKSLQVSPSSHATWVFSSSAPNKSQKAKRVNCPSTGLVQKGASSKRCFVPMGFSHCFSFNKGLCLPL